MNVHSGTRCLGSAILPDTEIDEILKRNGAKFICDSEIEGVPVVVFYRETEPHYFGVSHHLKGELLENDEMNTKNGRKSHYRGFVDADMVDVGAVKGNQRTNGNGDERVEFYETLGEARAALAMCNIGFDVATSGKEVRLQKEIEDVFELVIKTFFVIGEIVRSPREKQGYMIEVDGLQKRMESVIAELERNEYIEPLVGFIVPNRENADFFFAQSVINRLERTAVRANELNFLSYLNVLSDFVFVLAWYSSRYFEQWTEGSVTVVSKIEPMVERSR